MEQAVEQGVRGERSAQEERRASVRYRWPRATACCAVADRTDASWLAHVRDVSAFGLGLLLPRKLVPGTLLDVELKSLTGGAERSLWARVVHVRQLPEGEWKLGCAFAGELTDDDLRRLGGVGSRTPSGDARRWVRHPCAVETTCSTSLPSPHKLVPTRVVDVSPGGVGLVVPGPFAVGTRLHVDLPSTVNDPPKKVAVRVVRVGELANRGWFLGCEVADRLSDADLEILR